VLRELARIPRVTAIAEKVPRCWAWRSQMTKKMAGPADEKNGASPHSRSHLSKREGERRGGGGWRTGGGGGRGVAFLAREGRRLRGRASTLPRSTGWLTPATRGGGGGGGGGGGREALFPIKNARGGGGGGKGGGERMIHGQNAKDTIDLSGGGDD
jgi:hypothetical protein